MNILENFDTELHLSAVPYHPVRHDIAAVACYFNPQGSRSRQQSLYPFIRQWEHLGIDLYTIEGSINDTWYIPDGPNAFRVRIDPSAEMWHKETLLNLAISQLPDHYEKVLWVDADVIIMSPDYQDLLIESLSQHPVVQGFSLVQPLKKHNAWTNKWQISLGKRNHDLGSHVVDPSRAWPGLIWCAHREVLSKSGGLYDRCITGGGDIAWCSAIYGDTDIITGTYARNWSATLVADVMEYCHKVTVSSVGYVPSCIVHLYHGQIANRQYIRRNRVLGQERFDPRRDVTYAANGTLRWSDQASPTLIKTVRDYIHGRKEDD